MPRTGRHFPGGAVYHILNRAVARLPLFEKNEDYAAFHRVMCDAHERCPTRVLSYCLMPNHWHFVVWPREDGEVTEFFRWLTLTHTMRWHAHHGTLGTGHLYQGRFKSFPIQADEHLLAVLRYVERNPLRANLVARAEAWRWSSLWVRGHGDAEQKAVLSRWPIAAPRNWLKMVNRAQTAAEEESIGRAVKRGCPYGGRRWTSQASVRLGLEYTLRPRGRPQKT